MHIIHLHKKRKVLTKRDVIAMWKWPCPTMRENVRLTQTHHALTTLHVHGQCVMVYSGHKTPDELWVDMTDRLLPYSILCADKHKVETLALPALE